MLGKRKAGALVPGSSDYLSDNHAGRLKPRKGEVRDGWDHTLLCASPLFKSKPHVTTLKRDLQVLWIPLTSSQ